MKTAVITGATSGIGYAAAKALALKGWRIIGVGRTTESSETALVSLREETHGDAVFFYADLSRLDEVRRVAGEIAEYLEKNCVGTLDALINNAGGVRSRYTETPEGYEFQFALNHLAGVLLTYRLMPALVKAQGRILFTGSNSHKITRMRWNDIMSRKRYNPLMAYKRSKLAGMLFAREFNRRFEKTGVRAYVIDPGLVNTGIGGKQTGGIVKAFWSLRRRSGAAPEVPAKTYVHLCCGEAPEGLYFRDCAGARYNKRADDAEDAKRLFELSEKLGGIKFEE